MSPRFSGCHVPVDPGQRMGESLREAADGAFQKEPAIGDGSQLGRKRRQAKLIRGSAMCRNSHRWEEMLARVGRVDRASAGTRQR